MSVSSFTACHGSCRVAFPEIAERDVIGRFPLCPSQLNINAGVAKAERQAQIVGPSGYSVRWSDGPRRQLRRFQIALLHCACLRREHLGCSDVDARAERGNPASAFVLAVRSRLCLGFSARWRTARARRHDAVDAVHAKCARQHRPASDLPLAGSSVCYRP